MQRISQSVQKVQTGRANHCAVGILSRRVTREFRIRGGKGFPPRGIRIGFTLIELLVVIAIISLLVSILLPSLQQAKELARRTACLANLRSLGTGMIFYADDYNEWFISNDYSYTAGTTNFAEYFYPERLLTPPKYDYLAGLGGLWRGSYVGEWGNEDYSAKPGMFDCPSKENIEKHYSSYTYRGIHHSWLANYTRNYYGQDRISDPGRKGMIIDAWVWNTPLHGQVYNLWFSDGSAESIQDELHEIRTCSTPYQRWKIWGPIIDDLVE
jgi:prepilin-type N-terminal cleavage/methylation domain-containing protein